jgi:hypothetical protein
MEPIWIDVSREIFLLKMFIGCTVVYGLCRVLKPQWDGEEVIIGMLGLLFFVLPAIACVVALLVVVVGLVT